MLLVREELAERRAEMASTAQKLTAGGIAIGVIVVLTLPGRQTVPVLNSISKLTQGETKTVMGR